MDGSTYLIVVTLDDRRFALPLGSVDRIVHAVEVTPLPQAPDVVLGVINVQGRVVTVINLRKRCGVAEREIDPADQLVIAHTARRQVALLVDRVEVIRCLPGELVAAETVQPGLDYVREVVKRPEGLVLVFDVERLLSFQEEAALDRATEGPEGGAAGPPPGPPGTGSAGMGTENLLGGRPA